MKHTRRLNHVTFLEKRFREKRPAMKIMNLDEFNQHNQGEVGRERIARIMEAKLEDNKY